MEASAAGTQRARPEEGRHRLPGRADHRDRLHGARLLARGGARDRGRRGGCAGARGAARVLRPDVPDRVGVLLHEPRRSGLRHHFLVDHAGDGPEPRMGGRLGRGHHRNPRDRLARPGGGVLHVRPLRPYRAPRLHVGERGVHAADHRRDDHDLRARHRALRASAARDDPVPGRRPAAVRDRGPGQGRPPVVRALLALAVRRRLELRARDRPAHGSVHLLGLGERGEPERGDRGLGLCARAWRRCSRP